MMERATKTNSTSLWHDFILSHLSRINFPISIGKMSLFQILGVLVAIFIFIQLLIEHLVSKQ